MLQLPLEAKKSLIFDLFLSQEQKERRATRELYTSVRRSFENSSLAKEGAAVEMAQAIILAIYQVLKRELEDTAPPIAHALYKAAHDLILAEELFNSPAVDFSKSLTYQELWELRNTLRAKERFLIDTEKNLDRWYKHAHGGLAVVFLHLPESAFADQGEATFTVRLVDLLDDPVAVVESIQSVLLDESSPLEKTKKQLWDNVYRISPSRDKLIKPADLKNKSDDEIVEGYLYGTPLLELLHTPLPFPIPQESRFEHALICAGSGWGKTQTLQRFIYDDIKNNKSVCVIDSQGDLIRNILRLRDKNDVVLIDPTDIDHPPCLNMFDVKLSDDPVERERILNGTVELYQYLFGGLLGAELTMKQGALFGFIARLLISIPGATIHTLIDLMEHGERYREHINRLTGTGRRFFETQFFHRKFSATKDQIISRLYGVLGIPTLDRIFSHKQNKVNFFEAMNSGKIILINTAAGFLGQEGCSIFGRFFIAMLLQAALRRSETALTERTPCFLYIDEAYQYFDEQMETLFNQARKYRLGITIACLHLDQFPVRLRSSVMTSTAIKLAGGLNASDEHIFASALRVEKKALQSVRKYPDASEFVCSVRNVTDHAVKVTVPFFAMELAPELDDEEMEAVA